MKGKVEKQRESEKEKKERIKYIVKILGGGEGGKKRRKKRKHRERKRKLRKIGSTQAQPSAEFFFFFFCGGAAGIRQKVKRKRRMEDGATILNCVSERKGKNQPRKSEHNNALLERERKKKGYQNLTAKKKNLLKKASPASRSRLPLAITPPQLLLRVLLFAFVWMCPLRYVIFSEKSVMGRKKKGRREAVQTHNKNNKVEKVWGKGNAEESSL